MIMQTAFSQLQTLLKHEHDPETIFMELLPVLGETLQCDRCFLYLRNPQTKMGRVPYCWRRNDHIPTIFDPDWKPEPDSLADEDPMFAAALRAEPSIFVEDIETASSDVLNRKFEHENFGHRALIHAHLRRNGQLWGVLQPCVFGRSRTWTEVDRATISEVEKFLTPFAIAYVEAANC
ncbi:MAG: GAF domain-containing protein [Oscillatoriales cyanobacterium C42_A2020_001]|nr:GAF domain-containing protein [Leptolyngbyaceae cyanobacterium C42_A2020_001]